MMHDDYLVVRSDSGNQARRVRCRPYRSADGIADIDDLMRQLSDLPAYAPVCRIRVCRRAERCQGGAGPPCLHEATRVFVEAIADRMRGTRRFWARQRRLAAEREKCARESTR
jgi:hypothetical protein